MSNHAARYIIQPESINLLKFLKLPVNAQHFYTQAGTHILSKNYDQPDHHPWCQTVWYNLCHSVTSGLRDKDKTVPIDVPCVKVFKFNSHQKGPHNINSLDTSQSYRTSSQRRISARLHDAVLCPSEHLLALENMTTIKCESHIYFPKHSLATNSCKRS